MLTYIATMISATRLLRDEPVLVVVAILAAAFNAWALWGLGIDAIRYGLGLVVLGAPVYWMVRRGKRAEQA